MSFRLCPGARRCWPARSSLAPRRPLSDRPRRRRPSRPCRCRRRDAVGQRLRADRPRCGSLSIDEAVKLALQQNLGIQIERFNPRAAGPEHRADAGQLRAHRSARACSRRARTTAQQLPVGRRDDDHLRQLRLHRRTSRSCSRGARSDGGVRQRPATTNNIFSSFNPTLTGNLDVVDHAAAAAQLQVRHASSSCSPRRKNREIADVDLRQSVALTTRTVKNAYWDYVFSINALKVARQTLDLAQESLRNTRSRVEIGTLAPIDVVQAESEVASREEAVILAEASIGQSEDQLRSLIFDPKTPDFFDDARSSRPTCRSCPCRKWTSRRPCDRALTERTDLIATRKRLEITDYNVKYFKNQTLPGPRCAVRLQLHRPRRHAADPRPRQPAVSAAGHRRGVSVRMATCWATSSAATSRRGACRSTSPIRSATSNADAEPGAHADRKIPERYAASAARADTWPPRCATPARQLVANSKRVEATRRGARAGRAAAGSRREEVRGGHVHQLRGLPGPARPGAGPQQRAARGARLHPVAGRLRDGADRADRRRRQLRRSAPALGSAVGAPLGRCSGATITPTPQPDTSAAERGAGLSSCAQAPVARSPGARSSALLECRRCRKSRSPSSPGTKPHRIAAGAAVGRLGRRAHRRGFRQHRRHRGASPARTRTASRPAPGKAMPAQKNYAASSRRTTGSCPSMPTSASAWRSATRFAER